MSEPRKVSILLSGGIDSSTCVAYYAEKKSDIATFYFDINQPASKQERTAARKISRHYRTQHREFKINGSSPKNTGEIQARNATLLMCALMECRPDTGTLALGIHSGTRYFDSTPAFVSIIQPLVSAYTDGKLRVSAPFIDMTKAEVWTLAKKLHVPLRYTYSCQAGGPRECGVCDSCQDRRKINALQND